MKKHLLLSLAFWTLLLGGMVAWKFSYLHSNSEEQARIEARAIWEHNLSYRQWVTSLGGIYANIKKMPLNPHLKITDRDKKTVDGVHLTMANPAYMTRQVFEIIQKKSSLPIINRIVSDQYLNSINKPDEWESQGLRDFKTGTKEISALSFINGQPYIRLFKPMVTEKGCLKCHGGQGYKVGDIRGGISVSIPMKPYYEIEKKNRRNIIFIYSLLWILGSVSIIFFIRNIWKNQQLIKESEEKHRFFIESANDAVMIHTVVEGGEPGPFFEVNNLACKWFGYTREEFARLSPRELNDPQHLDHIPIVMEKLKNDGYAVFETVMLRKDGSGVPVKISSRLMKIRGIPYMLSIVRDITERKRAEEELKKSEKKFRVFFHNAAESMVIVGIAGEILEVNNIAIQRYGYSRSEFLKMKVNDLDAPDIPTDLEKNVKTTEEEGYSIFERVHHKKDGTKIPVEVSCSSIEYEGQKALLAIVRDITERKKAEEIIKDSHERLLTILDGLEAVVYVTDMQTYEVIFANKYVQNIFGDITGKICWKNLHANQTGPCDFCSNNKIIDADGRPTSPYKWEFKNTKTNQWFYMIDRAVRWIDGRVVRLGIASDITELKRAEESLRLANMELQTIYDNTYTMFAYMDKNFNFIRVNRAYAHAVGKTPEFFMGKNHFDLYPHAENEVIFRSVVKTGQPYVAKAKPFEYQEHPEWGISYWDWTLVPIFSSDKIVSGLILTLLNVTERKHTEEEISKLNMELEQRVIQRTAQLEASNKEMEAFSYSVSHDLRAPLRAINSYAHILTDEHGEQLDREARRLLDIISNQSDYMGKLIDDLLSFFRLGRQQIQISEIDMMAMVQSVYAELMMQEKGRKIEFRLNPLPQVHGDSSMIHQMWMNLLSNAIKFTRKKEVSVIEVGSLKEGDETVYYVKDNGAGFDMKYANKLFGVFQRLHRQEEFEGTGVGLALVQRIVHRHGGRIWAESKINEGAVFKFVFS